MNKDQAYGGIVLLISLAVTVLYVASLFAPYLALPVWLVWWAVALPVVMAVLAVLTICMWIGWVMLTTPPPELEPTTPESVESETKQSATKT